MYSYIPSNEAKEKEMLGAIGIDSIDKLFSHIPDELRLKDKLDLGEGMSEAELTKHMNGLAAKNQTVNDKVCFLGAGAYDRYIPSIIKHLAMRSEFYTAYTPYQPEISQGTLQAIFEFQSMIAELTGMDVANASMYDGPSACAEAAIMAARHTRKPKILISQTVNPETMKVVETYANFNDVEVEKVGAKNGVTDVDALAGAMGDDVGGVIIQSPNYLGQIEDIRKMEPVVHVGKTLMITAISDPLAYVFAKSPGACGADIVVGEGQSFGLPLNFGGPYLGFMAATEKLMRKLPGRIVGETTDIDGNRAFVLTLQAREQHIRREKATSNICSNQGLNALMATMYMSLLGKNGLKEVAKQALSKSEYAKAELVKVGFEVPFGGPSFEEFVVDLGAGVDAKFVVKELTDKDILCGVPLTDYEGVGEGSSKLLICVTEKRTKEEIDLLVTNLKDIVSGSDLSKEGAVK